MCSLYKPERAHFDRTANNFLFSSKPSQRLRCVFWESYQFHPENIIKVNNYKLTVFITVSIYSQSCFSHHSYLYSTSILKTFLSSPIGGKCQENCLFSQMTSEECEVCLLVLGVRGTVSSFRTVEPTTSV